MLLNARCLLRAIILPALMLLSFSACSSVLATTDPNPILITLPAQTPSTIEITETPTLSESTPELVVTPELATPTLAESIPPTPVPSSQGVGSTRLIWEWSETARPGALAASSSRLAMIMADGRFAWLNTNTGQVESSIFLWTGVLQGESWGEVYVDGLGTIAAAAIREQHINPQTNRAESRARFAMFDAQASEMWSLPELGTQHFYSAALTSISVVVGKWPQGYADNTLTSYDLYTGQKNWEVGGLGSNDEQAGYQQILHDGNRLYVVVNGLEQGYVISYDLISGDEIWRWSSPEMPRPSLISLGTSGLYVMSVGRMVSLDPLNGEPKWFYDIRSAPEAGLVIQQDFVYLAPAPAGDFGFRPGVIAMHTDDRGLAWHSLVGLLADPLTADGEAIWTIVKDFDSGNVWLSGLDLVTGLEEIRIPISTTPDVLYRLVAFNRRIYVLGETLLSFGY